MALDTLETRDIPEIDWVFEWFVALVTESALAI